MPTNPINIPDYLRIYGASKVQQSKDSFNRIINDFGGENVIAQITASGKTKLISDTVKDILYYGSIGSLWEAYVATEQVVITPEMAPFLTEQRKQQFKNRLIEAISSL
jgi:hypothetical protein